MSFREEIMTSVAAQQRGLSIKAGDRFLRGEVLVDVSSNSDGRISWREVSSGEEFNGPRRAFTGRAVLRMPAPPADGVADPVEAIWVIASAKQLAARERLRLLGELYPNTVANGAGLSAEDAEIVLTWIDALRRGQEPAR